MRGFDFGRLAGELVIACNVAALERPSPTVGFSICHRFMRTIATTDARWAASPAVKLFLDPPSDVVGVPHVRIGNCGDTWGRSLAGGLCQGPQTGHSALNLADVLGASPIYLLGMDCRTEDGGVTANYHDRYAWNADGKPRPKERRYRTARAYWERYAPEVRGRVVLLSDSALECFPRGALDEVLGPARQAGAPEGAAGLPAVPSAAAPLPRESGRVESGHRGLESTT